MTLVLHRNRTYDINMFPYKTTYFLKRLNPPNEIYLGAKSKSIMKGSGVDSSSDKWYNRKLPKSGKGIAENILKMTNILPQEFEGEHHIPLIKDKKLKMAQFCGPGTNIEKRIKRGDKGITRTDSICRDHDLDYLEISKSGLQNKDKGKLVREADKKMIGKLNEINSINSNIVKKGIQAKILAEDIGLLNKSKFVEGKGKYKKSKFKSDELLKLQLLKNEKKNHKNKFKNIING